MKSSAVWATSRQPVSMVNECPRLGISANSVTEAFLRCFLYAAWEIAWGTVWSFSPEMISIGPRFSALYLTFVSENGFKFAAAAWKIGTPDAATWNSSYSALASSSSTLFAQPYLNSSRVRVTERRAFAGLPRTGEPALSAETGRVRPPRPVPGSIETVATDPPSPAIFWAMSPPNEWPMTAGLGLQLPKDSA